MSPSYGMAAVHQLTDQCKWEAMLAALVRGMPGQWKLLEEDVADDLEVRLLEVSEAANFGNHPGVFEGNCCWASVEFDEATTQEQLQEWRRRRETCRRDLEEQGFNFEIAKLEQEIDIWAALPASLKAQVSVRHFRSLASKNVDFSPIVRIMQRFFGRTIYSTGFEHEGGRKDGVLRVSDGSASTFYAGLSFKFSEQHHQQQESQSQQQLSEQTNLAACKSSTSPRFPAAALAAHGNNSNSNININININCNNNININISGSSSNTNITAAALAAHSAAAEAEHVKQFLCQKLPVVMELKTRKGVAICRYTEEELLGCS
ncbi:unnamed protein product [Polarella glacialis]|uniref:Uncharacterized protein n=1 Tax=Polarella glacialis TaxID=89957 RepID=A0A813LPG0_POLGL|nr:unnamed protein product [Polarella glacialis]